MDEHKHRRQSIKPVTCAVITVSDTRTTDTDRTGVWIQHCLASAEHRVHSYEIIPDEPSRIHDRIVALCDVAACQVILLAGGTGLAKRDTTYDVVNDLVEKRLDGFGELFRHLSYAEIGPRAMLSRAVAGVRQQTAIFSLPGSPSAVELAMNKLILPELGHIVWLLT